ncbi:hypothetical protein TREMEDRAFT_60641 [Tremella mesenterica DSM 1558]|uniref:uncharacterized protein n=1 Tax=Tremella mesenterica (strain ATCC 24925 / CBS 8224 / DSM 1558 / NBRC 9311 / NRRL Y-6157 / RJB 2259-6 / UBC 559-6) TaxID=578456 RepID=UPI0003F49523|nr:uncharacterized protein TREMEDRAFT_60641 [Tremella mesenterica DSM 1558]EIW71725.1 hypothetical protein TREMEDRAFT_60641 [Tremella mesenterica DSM 1558]
MQARKMTISMTLRSGLRPNQTRQSRQAPNHQVNTLPLSRTPSGSGLPRPQVVRGNLPRKSSAINIKTHNLNIKSSVSSTQGQKKEMIIPTSIKYVNKKGASSPVQPPQVNGTHVQEELSEEESDRLLQELLGVVQVPLLDEKVKNDAKEKAKEDHEGKDKGEEKDSTRKRQGRRQKVSKVSTENSVIGQEPSRKETKVNKKVRSAKDGNVNDRTIKSETRTPVKIPKQASVKDSKENHTLNSSEDEQVDDPVIKSMSSTPIQLATVLPENDAFTHNKELHGKDTSEDDKDQDPVIKSISQTSSPIRPSKAPIAIPNKTFNPLGAPWSPNGTTSDSFDTSPLSHSLPTLDVMHKVKQSDKVKDESAVWDMPEVNAGPQEKTWQQLLMDGKKPKIDKYDRNNQRPSSTGPSSPTKSSKRSNSPPNLKNPNKPRQPRPTHSRRLSLDDPSVRSTPTSFSSLSPIQARSVFDTTLDWYPTMNVNRPPQTPFRRLPTHVTGELPLIPGEFPRINRSPVPTPIAQLTKAVTGSPQKRSQKKTVDMGRTRSGSGGADPSIEYYAGPSFHNAPAAHTLSPPDMSDW